MNDPVEPTASPSCLQVPVCPSCDHTLHEDHILSASVLRCLDCHLELYRDGELEASATSYRPEELTSVLSGLLRHAGRERAGSRCPGCSEIMRMRRVDRANVHVELEQCLGCRSMVLEVAQAEALRSLLLSLAPLRDVKIHGEKGEPTIWWRDHLGQVAAGAVLTLAVCLLDAVVSPSHGLLPGTVVIVSNIVIWAAYGGTRW